MRSHINPLILTLAIGALSASAFAQQGPGPAGPNQPFQNQSTAPAANHGNVVQTRPLTQVGTVTQTTVLSDVQVNSVLGLPTSHCGHVIDLLHSNRMRQNCGQLGDFPCTLPHEAGTFVSGDLQLEAVTLIGDGTPLTGPVFDIALCNQSAVAIGSFRISIVGILGRIHVHSPTTTIRVSGLNVGQKLNVQMQLPGTCMAMGPAGTQPAPFDTLIVAIDSFDEWVEQDELNNVRIVSRSEIGVLVTESTIVETTESDGSPVEVPSQEPIDESPTPDDSIDLDDLDFGEADESSIRFGDALR